MKCEVQGCRAEAKRKLRMPKVHVCEVHYLRNLKARRRMASIRHFWKKHVGEYSPNQGVRHGPYSYTDARKKKDLLLQKE